MMAMNLCELEYHRKKRMKHRLMAPNPEIKGDQIVLYAKHMILKRIVLKSYQKLVE